MLCHQFTAQAINTEQKDFLPGKAISQPCLMRIIRALSYRILNQPCQAALQLTLRYFKDLPKRWSGYWIIQYTIHHCIEYRLMLDSGPPFHFLLLHNKENA